MAVVLVFEVEVMRLICGNALECGRRLEENCLYLMSWQLKGSADDLVMCMGDFN